MAEQETCFPVCKNAACGIFQFSSVCTYFYIKLYNHVIIIRFHFFSFNESKSQLVIMCEGIEGECK